jgi:hypothetical protein
LQAQKSDECRKQRKSLKQCATREVHEPSADQRILVRDAPLGEDGSDFCFREQSGLAYCSTTVRVLTFGCSYDEARREFAITRSLKQLMVLVLDQARLAGLDI